MLSARHPAHPPGVKSLLPVPRSLVMCPFPPYVIPITCPRFLPPGWHLRGDWTLGCLPSPPSAAAPTVMRDSGRLVENNTYVSKRSFEHVCKETSRRRELPKPRRGASSQGLLTVQDSCSFSSFFFLAHKPFALLRSSWHEVDGSSRAGAAPLHPDCTLVSAVVAVVG